MSENSLTDLFSLFGFFNGKETKVTVDGASSKKEVALDSKEVTGNSKVVTGDSKIVTGDSKVDVETVIAKNDRIRASLKLEDIVSKYNYNINDYFFKINAYLDNYAFEFTPTLLYLILGEDKDEAPDNYIVCLYNLKMTDKVPTKGKINVLYEANIPYYMSNGLTNHLRANLLLPFICFNIEETKENCPFNNGSTLAKGGLFKYSIIDNLNFDKIINDIRSKCSESYFNSLYEYSNGYRRGILSVISRIDNLLDFLICLNNKNIINFKEEDIMKYHPIIGNIPDELNMDVNVNPTFYNDYEDSYKKLLLSELKRLITGFKNLNVVEFEKVDLKLEKDNIITKSFFNKYKNNPIICNNHRISKEANANGYNYSIISENFGYEIKRVIYKNSINGNLKSADYRFTEEFLSLTKKVPYIYDDDVLDLQMVRWQARCYKKYLKYKSKYLKLKQLN